jgi:IS30 family transposase
MPQYDSITKIKICWSLYQNNISIEDIPIQLGIHRATVYRWIKKINQLGIREFLKRYKRAKKGRRKRNKTDILTKLYIYKIRQENHNCCGEKIKYFLKKQYNINISVATIYNILNEKYILRSKWKKYCKRGHVKQGNSPREAIQTDTVDFGGLYAFTSIDTYTKEVSVIMKSKLTAQAGKEALKQQLDYFKTISHIQKDGGSEFKKEWLDYAKQYIPSIRTARPYKKNEQAYIERFNGVLRKECLGYIKYKKEDLELVQHKVNEYIEYYHKVRPHLSLNMKTPYEFVSMSHLT